MKLFNKTNSSVATILNIFGLTFAFAALYIIIVQVHYDFSYNHDLKDSDRLYVLTSPDWYEEGKYSTYLNRPISEKIIAESPIIERGGMIESFGSDYQFYPSENSDPVNLKLSIATIAGIETIGYEPVEGNPEDWTGSSIALSESFASKLGLHAGDHVNLVSTDFFSSGKPQEVTIAFIYKDMPAASDFSLHDGIYNFGDFNIDEPSEWSYKYFVKTAKRTKEADLNRELNDLIKQFFMEQNGMPEKEAEEWVNAHAFRFFPITDVYFNPMVRSTGLKGNKTTTFSLLAIAILIIIIAFINYINFFFALIPIKLKDINTRKILGSSRRRLMLSLICESMVYVLIALGLGTVLVVIFSHSPYSSLISTSVLFRYHWGMTFITIGAALLIAVLSSIFPAYYITSFNPAMAIRGFIGRSAKGDAFRTALITFQFTISIILVVCAIVINRQRDFMLHHNLGFDKDNLLTVAVSPVIAEKNETVESRLKAYSDISDITWADGPIVASSRMGWVREINGEPVYFQTYPVAWNFLKFMNIPVVEGRDFERSDIENENGLFIMNETAVYTYGFKIGDRFTGHRGDDNPAEVIGFAKDFNYRPLRETGGAFCFYQFGKYPWRPLKQLFVRTQPNANPIEVKDKIVSVLCELDPERDKNLWDVQLFDNTLERLYSGEKNLSRLINLFTLLAIVISLMGVFGLVMFDTQRRKKEIGIRRVNGASIEEIIGMFNMKFIKIVLVSFIIAVPVSWWIMTVYLQAYAYRTPIYIWIYFIALLAVLIITTGVVTLRSYKAASANPVHSLATE